MRRREQTPINFWKCGHFPPVVIEKAEGGKIARCLLCGELGAVREGSEEALGTLRDLARQRDEAQSA
jgi:hypothetical protein